MLRWMVGEMRWFGIELVVLWLVHRIVSHRIAVVDTPVAIMNALRVMVSVWALVWAAMGSVKGGHGPWVLVVAVLNAV